MVTTGSSPTHQSPRKCTRIQEGDQETAKDVEQGKQETTESNEESREGAAEGDQEGESPSQIVVPDFTGVPVNNRNSSLQPAVVCTRWRFITNAQ
jgi:hypothetical protein